MAERKKYLIIIFTAVCLVLFGASGYSGGKFTEQKEYWDNGKVRACKFFDDEGNPREINYYREDGRLQQNEKYDGYGHEIEVSYYDESGRLREGADGWAAIKRVYEGDNLVIESYYSGDGHLKERKQYNELGDLVSKQYVGDGSILPDEEYNPVPTLAGETVSYYDSYGRPEAETSVVEE